MHLTTRFAIPCLALTLAATGHAFAGTAALAWDPVSATDLAGYRVYIGTASGVYTSSVDVGKVTQTTLSGLADCTGYYFGVKAYDSAGNESTAYSNEVTGWTRPVVSSVSPSSAEQGRSLTLTVTGASFKGGATASFSNAGITVNSVTVNGCGQLTMNVTVSGSAAPGTTGLDVTDPDGVYGTGAGLFTVVAATAPTVQSTSPAGGATGVTVSVKPTITFSEAMVPSSITVGNVRLLDGSGAAVAQAAGSPALSGDGLTATIFPAASLTQGMTYKIQAAGGATGVLDLSGHGMAATYTQSTGFTTAGDTTPPSISAVASGSIAPTAATITWTTNEASDSQVFYRRQGDAAYQQTAVDATKLTGHTVALQGLPPASTIEYYVRSADAAGNVATSTPVQRFNTSASAFTYIRFEAEGGALTPPVRSVGGAADAFGSSYLDTPTGTAAGTPNAPSGTAVFGVNVPTAGTWTLWLRQYGSGSGNDDWFESIDGAARQAVHPSQSGVWKWTAGRSYSLTSGLHSLELGGNESNARIDRVLLTNDPAFVPTEQAVGDQTAPQADTALAGAPSSGQVTLTWVNSSSSDYAQTVIRYRTDGVFPVSPADGFPVLIRGGSPGLPDNYTHTGLTNGTTYSYSAFAVDGAGNTSAKSTLQATPVAKTPPGQVQNARRGDKKP